MSEFEVAELITLLMAEAGRTTMDFITVLFAYFVLTHFVGAKLERAYIVILTIVYSLFCILPILGAYQAGTMLFKVVQSNPEAGKYLGIEVAFNPGIAPVVVLGLAWFLSLTYMFQVRKKAKRENVGEVSLRLFSWEPTVRPDERSCSSLWRLGIQ